MLDRDPLNVLSDFAGDLPEPKDPSRMPMVSMTSALRKAPSTARMLLIAATLACCSYRFVAVTDLYVSTTGSDSNPGTQSSPYATILAASKVAQPGDTIHVAAGTYYGGFQTTASGTASAPIHYVSDTPWGATIVPPPNSTSENGWDQRGNYVVIDGFNVDGANYQGGTFWTVGIQQAGSYSVVENSHVQNIMTNASQVAANGSNGGAGILLEGYWGGSHISAIGNVVDHIGPSDPTASGAQYVQGIYASSGYDTIANNIVSNVSCDGISNYHDATNNTIVNNTIFHCYDGIDLWGGGTYNLTTTPDHFFVANNIVYANTYGVLEGGTVGTHDTITNNLLNGNGSNWSLAHATPQNTITGAPQFVNYVADGSGNYQLQAGSPAIDAGTATNAPATDFAGTARPQGAGYDIGAYEFAASMPTPAPTPTTISALAPTLSVQAASGNEDTAIPLVITAAQAESDLAAANLTVTVSGLQGATLNHGTLNPDGSYTLHTTDLQGLTLTPTLQFSGELALTATATDTDAAGQTSASSGTQGLSIVTGSGQGNGRTQDHSHHHLMPSADARLQVHVNGRLIQRYRILPTDNQ